MDETPLQFPPSSFAKAHLLGGPLYLEDGALWETLLRDEAEIAGYFRQIGLELIVDAPEVFAFLRQLELNNQLRDIKTVDAADDPRQRRTPRHPKPFRVPSSSRNHATHAEQTHIEDREGETRTQAGTRRRCGIVHPPRRFAGIRSCCPALH